MSACPKCGTTYPPRVRICTLDGTVLEDEAPTTADTTEGTLLDRKYRLDAPLGRGGMGAVYRATHVMLGKTVAVKLIKADLVGSPDMVRRFQREARAATSLNHPNIVAVFDLGQAGDGTLYIAMELVEGRSLKEVVTSGGPMQPQRIAHLLTQVASALAVAHRHDIVHRDLKPQNLMITRGDDGSEMVKLLDFGIAKTREEGATQLTQTGFALGTPQYMAPEQAAGKTVDGRTDLYALGVILYEMLTGEVPFNDPSTPAVLVKHLSELPEPPSRRKAGLSISPLLERAALKCLEKDPANRFQTAEEFIAAIAPVREQAAVDGAAATVIFPSDPAPGVPAHTPTSAPTAQTPPQAVAAAAETPAAHVPPPPPIPAPPAAPAAAAPEAAAAPPLAPARSTDTRPTAVGAASPASAAAPSAPATRTGASRGLIVGLSVAALVIILFGAAAGLLLYRFGYIGGGGDAAEALDVPQASPAMASSSPQAGDSTAADPSAPPDGAAAGDPQPAESGASSGTPGDGGAAAAASGPASPAAPASGRSGQPAELSPRTTPRSNTPAPVRAREAAASRQAAAPVAAPAAALPAVPLTYVECTGAPDVCGALRSAIIEALQREGVSVTRRGDAADVVLTAEAQPGETQSQEQFGTTFVVQSVTIDVAGESPRLQNAEVPMPAPRTFTYDSRFGRDRVAENARVVAGQVAERVMRFWSKMKNEE